MDEKPTEAVRAKPNSSLVVACRAVGERKADAVVSAGNTGAMLAACLLELRRIPGVRRPAIAVTIPARRGPSVLLDSGANADARPEDLVQFAHMGAVFAEEILGVARPEIRLLSIGEEPEKGSLLSLEAHRLLAATDLNFAGNTEGRDLLTGAADVVVTDGFTGNVALKVTEGTIQSLARGPPRGDHRNGRGEARGPADQAGRPQAAQAARPGYLRRRVPARPPGTGGDRARELVQARHHERRQPGRPRRREGRRRQAGSESGRERVSISALYDPDPQREVTWQRRVMKSTSESRKF